jgi:tetratricopeptide (TPR) repeat protein
LELKNKQLQESNNELVEFKKNYDRDELVNYYKDMQSDYQSTVSMVFTVFSILIAIGAVGIPVYSQYREHKELEKIKKYLDETKEAINNELEESRMLKKELDEKLEVNRLILEAKILENSGNYFEAIEIIKEALNMHDIKELYELLAHYYELDKDIENTIKILEKAINVNKFNYNMIYKLADIYLGKNDYASALKYFKLAIKDNSEDYRGYYSIGKTFEFIDDLKNASANYEIALNLNPTLTAVYVRLSQCYINLNDEKRAIEILKKGNKLIPNNYKILDGLVDLLVKNNNKIEAEKIIETFEGDNFKKANLRKHLDK